MRSSVRATLLTALLGLLLPAGAAAATSPAAGYGSRLEMALNGGDQAALSALVGPQLQERLQRRYERFVKGFPQSSWSVDLLESMGDGRPRLRVSVVGTGRSDGLLYRLNASQTLAVRLEAGVMLEEEVLDERSLLRSGTARLPISVRIPGAVLTGSRYDIDVIVDEPLGPAVLAGGLVELNETQTGEPGRPAIQLEPLGGGGLFKRVQAPQQPGVQTWAVMLVHPDGVVTTTGRVRVVSSKAELARY